MNHSLFCISKHAFWAYEDLYRLAILWRRCIYTVTKYFRIVLGICKSGLQRYFGQWQFCILHQADRMIDSVYVNIAGDAPWTVCLNSEQKYEAVTQYLPVWSSRYNAPQYNSACKQHNCSGAAGLKNDGPVLCDPICTALSWSEKC